MRALVAVLSVATVILLLGALDLPSSAIADLPEECDSSAGGDVFEDAESQTQLARNADVTIETPPPDHWRIESDRHCQRYNGREVCDGPLRVPLPIGAAAERATQLGIEEINAGRIALNRSPPEAWQAATSGHVADGLLWPVPAGTMWRGFGMHRELHKRGGRVRQRRRRRMHRGVDIGAPAGSPIRAVNDGLVVYSYNRMRGYGNTVVLLHSDGTITLYAHCQATLVFAGQSVRRGQIIAEVGATGLAHGAHLHFEWRRNGQAMDPAPHFQWRPSRVRDDERGHEEENEGIPASETNIAPRAPNAPEALDTGRETPGTPSNAPDDPHAPLVSPAPPHD